MRQPKFHASAGIAIGPILFVVAMLAIRTTINQCNMSYNLAVSTGSVAPTSDPYPSSAGTGTAVSAITCTPTGGSAMFGGTGILLPPPTAGFNAWNYIDAAAGGGGRCIWTSPSGSNPLGNSGIVAGLTRAAAKFNSSTSYVATSEVIYDPASTSQKFVAWITMPSGTASSYCLP
jgi:hypothetical protein